MIKTGSKNILQMNKIDWMRIGLKTKWLKISQETELIDGVLYDENLNPVIQPPKSFTVQPYNITFTEGQTYENYYGFPTVLKIHEDNGTMDVSYQDQIKNPSVLRGNQ